MYSLGEPSYCPKAAKLHKKNFTDWLNHYKAKGCNDRKASECAGRKGGKAFHL